MIQQRVLLVSLWILSCERVFPGNVWRLHCRLRFVDGSDSIWQLAPPLSKKMQVNTTVSNLYYSYSNRIMLNITHIPIIASHIPIVSYRNDTFLWICLHITSFLLIPYNITETMLFSPQKIYFMYVLHFTGYNKIVIFQEKSILPLKKVFYSILKGLALCFVITIWCNNTYSTISVWFRHIFCIVSRNF